MKSFFGSRKLTASTATRRSPVQLVWRGPRATALPILRLLPMENHSLLLRVPSEVKNSTPKDSIRSPALSQSENQIQLQKIELPFRKTDVLGMSHKGKRLLLRSQYWCQRSARLGAHLPWRASLQDVGHPLPPENRESTLPCLCNHIKPTLGETPLWSSRHHL